ncbi:MAG: malate dehydrogenase [Dehalococcoidia bacterium]|jgi:malate dehydrogenase|nr:malate dehydrogenase [Dehalococcoidia bacterium]
MRKKITVVGAGNVGASCAQRLAERGYADVVLVDIVPSVPQGKALDIQEAAPVVGIDSLVTGVNSYEASADSDVVVITAGVPRKPGMSRDDLVTTNQNIVASITRDVLKHSPDCIIVAVTNPLDAMAHVILKESGFPRCRVVGMSGILDTARFRTFIALEFGVSVEDVQALVLGGHGDQMVPLPRIASVGGIPLPQLLPQETIDRLVQRAVKGGGEIVELLNTSAYYAPSAAAVQMVDAIALDKKRILPAAAYLEGEYGIEGVFLGVPVKLGAGGVEQIMQVELSPDEQEALKRSAAAVRELVEVTRKG